VAIQPEKIRIVGRREIVDLRGTTLPVLRLEELFDLPRSAQPPRDADRQFMIVVGLAQHRVGLIVDELYHQQDIIIKPLGATLEDVRGIAGATILGSQKVVLVLDLAALIEDILDQARNAA